MSTTSTVDILLAEDEEHIAKLIGFKLGKEGFNLSVARNGEEALTLLPAKSWQLVILDIMMPIKDGWEVLRGIRASSQKDVPVLMLTAKSHQKDVINAAQLGATKFLKKPFDPGELAVMVKQMLAHADSGGKK